MRIDPRDPRFWTLEERNLWAFVIEMASLLIFKGALNGSKMLPAIYAPLISWDVVNVAAMKFLKDYRLGTIWGIHETTRGNVIRSIEDWILGGEPLPALETRLAYWLGPVRAERIATTEVTRLYAEGNLMAWRATGFIGAKRWNTANDDLVCPICEPLNGMIVGLDTNGFTTEVGGIGLTAPPAHPRCRCWMTPVVDEEMSRRSRLERLYR